MRDDLEEEVVCEQAHIPLHLHADGGGFRAFEVYALYDIHHQSLRQIHTNTHTIQLNTRLSTNSIRQPKNIWQHRPNLLP